MTKCTQTELRKLDTIGCDLGDSECTLFVIRPDESTDRPDPIKTSRAGFRKFFRNRPRSHVALEVGTHSRWVDEELRKLGHEVTIANPRQVRLIAESEDKTDDHDPEDLARLARADVELLKPITHRGEEAQADLAILKARDGLVQCRTKLINQARSLTKSFGYRLPKCEADCFHRKTKESVPEVLEPALGSLYEVLEKLDEQIRKYDAQIDGLAKKYPDVAQVSQPDGVGDLTAVAYVLTIEDPARFEKSRTVGAYLGMRTKKRKSGKKDPELRITKAGDPFLRRLLVQSAAHILRSQGRDSDLRRWGLDLAKKKGGKTGKKKARIAVARKLAVLMHRLWVTGEVYQRLGYAQMVKEQRKKAVQQKSRKQRKKAA